MVDFNIVATQGVNGVIAPDGTTVVASGDSQAYTITPNTNYKIKDVIVDSVNIGITSDYVFSTVNADHTITADFDLQAPISGGAYGAYHPRPLNIKRVNYGIETKKSIRMSGEGLNKKQIARRDAIYNRKKKK